MFRILMRASLSSSTLDPRALRQVVTFKQNLYTPHAMPTRTLQVSTRRQKQVIDITPRVEQYLDQSGIREGLCNVFVTHTTVCLTTGEAIEGTDEDLMETLEKMIPKIDFRHAHDPSHAPDHMISSILSSSLTIPVLDGKLQLGSCQRVLLAKHTFLRAKKPPACARAIRAAPRFVAVSVEMIGFNRGLQPDPNAGDEIKNETILESHPLFIQRGVGK